MVCGSSAQVLASKRRIAVIAVRGEVVPFDPAMHEAQATIQRNSSVRIVVPAVIKQNEGRASTIITKAIVEML